MNEIPVLIVGAGPSGLVLALWLTKAGIPVRIIDKTAEPGTTSRAIGVQARTLELYRQLGIAELVVQHGVEVAGGNLWVRGKRVVRIALTDIGRGLSPFAGIIMFQQDEHERMLIAELGALGVHVERCTELLKFSDDGTAIHATLRRPDGSEERCDASFLAGCDGAHSAVREGLAIGFPGGTYDELFYVADAAITGPVANSEVHIDVGSSDFLAVFPLAQEGRVRLIGTVIAPTEAEQRALTFDDVSEKAIREMNVTISKVNWFSTYRVHHRVAEHFRSGRAFLLGDAGHIHSPVGAQGMNTGIGDAVNLAWKLAAVLKNEATLKLLDSYEPERIGFARKLVETTDRIFTVVTGRSSMDALIRTKLVPMVLPLAIRLPRVRTLFFRILSQIWIEYADGPLSSGKAGRISGGDRLPWVPIEGATDNFTPLTSIGWQVHVYGETQPGVKEICKELRVPLHRFRWSEACERAGLSRSALYLVRPDGYVALADQESDPARLRQYFVEREITPAW